MMKLRIGVVLKGGCYIFEVLLNLPVWDFVHSRKFMKEGIRYIKNEQRLDGSWFGSWAICFTYATWFGLECLQSIGENYSNSDSCKRGCDFLIEKQREDGGWGESYRSCEEGVYIQHESSQVVNTAWAVMGLLIAGYPDEKKIQRGIQV